MTTPAQPLSLPRLLVLGAVGAIAYVGFFIAVAVTVPSAAMMASDHFTPLPGWMTLVCTPRANDLFFYLWDAMGFVLLGSLVVSLLVFLSEKVRRFASSTLFFAVLGTSALAIYLLGASAVSLRESVVDAEITSRAYASALEDFSLLEGANGRLDRVREIMAKHASVKMVEVKDVSLLTPSDRRLRLNALVKLGRSNTDPALRQSILATAYLFREDIQKDPDLTKFVLDQARTAGVPEGDREAVFQWLKPKIGTEGWKPLPLQTFQRQR